MPPFPGISPPRLLLACCVVLVAFSACDAGAPEQTPPPAPGTAGHPRDVNIVTREYGYSPPVVDLVPGETVLFHVVNAGLEIHEVVIGDVGVQDAWEAAEAATAGAPPGPTPAVSVTPALAGLRIVVPSGARVDALWTVPTDGPPLIVGCHIPGHWEKGMQVPIRMVSP